MRSRLYMDGPPWSDKTNWRELRSRQFIHSFIDRAYNLPHRRSQVYTWASNSPLGSFSLSSHLLADNAGHYLPAFGFQQGFGIDTPEEFQERSNQTGPACLMAGAKPRSVVAVEVLVKQNQVAPMRIFLEFRRSPVDRPLPIGIAQESARQPALRSPSRHFEQRHVAGRNRSDTQP